MTAVIFAAPLLGAGTAGLRAAPNIFADATFRTVWERTDAPVLAGQATRSWYWGPEPGVTKNEPYSGSSTGQRLVQYFDKARMEINNPGGDRKSQWFVTTGLLVAEMVSGKQQVGDKDRITKHAAEIAVGGDGLGTDPDAPTYTSFRPVASLTGPGANRAPKALGQPVTASINRAGQVGSEASLGLYPGARIAAYSEVLGHNIPQAMWDFLNLKGPVQQNGELVPDQAIANWIFVMGYPITEPYWAKVKIGGIIHDVMFQLYERRSLAYVPSMSNGWQVQMGNAGQHYYRWLYGGPLPAPRVIFPTPVAAGPTLPPQVDAEVSPTSTLVGSPVTINVRGFTPGEAIASWLTSPEGEVADTRMSLAAGTSGAVSDIALPTRSLSPGVWAVTFHGMSSRHQSIAYFHLSAQAQPPRSTVTAPPANSTVRPLTPTPSRTRTRTPTPRVQGTPEPSPTIPNVPTEPPAGMVLSVRPGSGPATSQFTFTASGLGANEQVLVKFTDPMGATVYPNGSNNGRYTADGAGRLVIMLVPQEAFPSAPAGFWLFEVRAVGSGAEGVIGFSIR